MNRVDLHALYGSFALDACFEWSEPSVGLFGPSGSGKSTIIEAIAGLRAEVSGEIRIRGRRLDGLAARERRVGWVPQDASLFPHLSLRENIEFAGGGRPFEPRTRAVIEALEIGDLLDQKARTLSGGERQRAAIARAMAMEPDILLLDEPLASLDRPRRLRILPFLERIAPDFGIPILIVSHDPLEIAALARRVFIVEGGRIVDAGSPATVFSSPAHFGAVLALGAENRYRVVELIREKGVHRIRTAGGLDLAMPAVQGFAAPRTVAIRAEDVLVSIRRAEGISARNVVEARVESIDIEEGSALVRTRVAEEVVIARLTLSAIQALALAPGLPVWLVIKAHSVLALD